VIVRKNLKKITILVTFTSTTSPLGFEIQYFYSFIKINIKIPLSYILIVSSNKKNYFEDEGILEKIWGFLCTLPTHMPPRICKFHCTFRTQKYRYGPWK
jgi:hypothetical protein